MTRTWNKAILLCLSFILLGACSNDSDDANGQSKPVAVSNNSSSEAIVLSTNGIGPINNNTSFNIHDITQLFNELNVSQQTSFQEGDSYPVIRVAKGAKTLMTINPTADLNGIYSVVVEDNLIQNHLGHRLSTKFSNIYNYGQVEKCQAGQEELSGKTICYAPKARNILYIFKGRWSGPNNEIPPEDVLASWTLNSIIWKPAR